MPRRNTKPPGKASVPAGFANAIAVNRIDANDFKLHMPDGWRSNRDDFAALAFTLLPTSRGITRRRPIRTDDTYFLFPDFFGW